ncbi:hypothetical protein BDW_02240 [Bdellovibrio bacteriovorus W]|nr:hypothetical protein BDW_02240 [Bdellovibrio bacteriovorus W]
MQNDNIVTTLSLFLTTQVVESFQLFKGGSVKRLLSIVAVGMLATQAWAQESSTTQSTSKMGKVLENKKFSEDRDITDIKLRAESGSLSRYSLKFSLSYYGPPVGDITNDRQPNPDGSIGNNDTAITGSISGRYRIDSKSAIGVGTGMSSLTPFHGSKRTDIKTPFISYDRNARLQTVQMRNSYSASFTTVQEYLDVGQVGTVGYNNNLVYNLGNSGFAVGLESSFSGFVYNRDYEKSDRSAGRYYLGFYPQVKYNLTDKIDIYSSLAVSFTNPRAREDVWTLHNRTLSGRLGSGFALTRDVYISGFLNYYPTQLKADSTTISLSTVFSIL